MSTITAVYEGGVFRPATPLDLPEGTSVEVVVPDPPPASPSIGEPSVYAILAAITARSAKPGLPESVARDHDKYLYGEKGDHGDVR